MPDPDVVIIGGGVIGLSTALELADYGVRVQVLDRQQTGQEASWAGAGMIPPGEIHLQSEQYRRLARQSSQLWAALSRRLREQTGIDNEYHRCGALIFARSAEQIDQQADEILEWNQQGVRAEKLTAAQLAEQEPALTKQSVSAYLLAEQGQVRNPRHLQALKAACLQQGVIISEQQTVRQIDFLGDRMSAVRTETEVFTAGKFLWATGAWSGELESQLQWSMPVQPIRGQLLLLKTAGQLSHIVEQGKRYLVPRLDGRLLVGSTEEYLGFERQTDSAHEQDLLNFAQSYLPEITASQREQSWCGFRPGTPDHLPVLGQLPGWENSFMATGHYRAGLSLSPITARLMRQLLLKEPLELPLEDFSPERFSPLART